MTVIDHMHKIWGLVYKEYWLRNEDTGEVYPLGPMYGGSVSSTVRKLEHEDLQYSWTLLAPIARRHPSGRKVR